MEDQKEEGFVCKSCGSKSETQDACCGNKQGKKCDGCNNGTESQDL